MRVLISRVLIAVMFLSAAPAVTKLPPKILADSHLLRAEQAIRDGDPARARTEIDKILLLQKEHQLNPSGEFHFRLAKVAAATDRPDQVLNFVEKYLLAAGQEGQHYVEALELMNEAGDAIKDQKGQRMTTLAQEQTGSTAGAEQAPDGKQDSAPAVLGVAVGDATLVNERPETASEEKSGFGCVGTGEPKDWSGRNLRKAKLERENLSGFNLSGADLEKAKLRNADLRGANLERAKLRKVDLRGANLCEANLRHADLYKTDLRGADLRGADLRGADLNKAKLAKANLHKVDLRGAKVRNLSAYQVDLSGANIHGGYVRKVNLWESDLRNANLHKADLSGAKSILGDLAFNTKLGEADLRGVDLSEADLRWVNFYRADLRNVNMRRANLEGVYLREAKLQNADLRGANLYKANLHKADLRTANLQGANLNKTKDLHKANLQGANLSGAIRRGTRQNSGPGALGAAIGIIGGTAIAAAGGGSEEALAAGAVFAEGAISGRSPAGSATSAPGNVPPVSVGAGTGGGQCEIPGYPRPANVQNLGLSWCPATVDFQARVFALQAAGAQCAIATGSSSTPEQIQARRQEIQAACERLAALGVSNCQCP